MRNIRCKRIIANILAFVMVICLGMANKSGDVKAASGYTILETDVSTASSGCTMLGVKGTYYVDAQKALDRINEIRKEACDAGNVPDPRNSSRMLTASDYVPIKWSADLERIARIRAMEGGLYITLVEMAHGRLNGKSWSSVQYNGLRAYGEVLAFNYSEGNFILGINQWYGEKSAWVNQTSGADTGHYTSMINPNNTYVGLGDFYTTASMYPNTLSGEFNTTSQSLSQTSLSGYTDIMQKIEVKDSYINKYYLDGEETQYIGETQTLTPMAHLVNGSKTVDLWVIDNVTYTSSDTTVASVTADGTVSAKKAGTTTITCKKGSTSLCTMKLTVSCNHNKVLQSTVAATCQKEGEKIYKCSKCGTTIKETIEKAPHSYVYGTTDSTGKATGVCSVCNATITIVPPTTMTLWWKNSESSGNTYYSKLPSENPVGSEIKCWVDGVDGDSGYQEVLFESTDNSVVEAPAASVSSGIISFKVKKAGIAIISIYPKYNPSVKKTYTVRVGETGSVDISNASVTLAKTSIACGASTSALAPTVTYNGIKLTSGTDYTVSYSSSGTTGTCTIAGKGIFTNTVKKTYTITHTYVEDTTVTGALKSEATCTKKAVYYKSCSKCKQLGTDTFESGSPEAHSYTIKNVDAEHLASKATCTTAAKYYYTCSKCGERGTTTFEYGDTLPHDYTAQIENEETLKEAANCKSPAVYYYSCSVCGVVDKSEDAETYTYGPVGSHSYTKKIISDEYLVSEADCETPAVYHYGCTGCGKIGTAIYSYGKALGHSYTKENQSEEYKASEATCTSPAKYYYLCSRCNRKGTETYTYGTASNHSYTKKVVSDEYLASEATYTSPAVYYYSCAICGKVGKDKTFTYGSALQKTDSVDVTYKTHIQTYGDSQPAKKNGEMAGTSGEAKRLENIWIRVSGDANLGVQYTTHCQTYGWLPWSSNGEKNGTSGEAKRLEAIKIRLTGADQDKYDIYYRVHAQSFGWLAWAKNGEPSGTAGYGKRLEGIQIVVKKKGEAAPGLAVANVNPTSANSRSYVALNNSAIQIPGSAETVNVMYKTHVQSFGWQNWKTNGQMSGTSGKAKRLEGINIKLSNAPYTGGVQYTTHVQTYGWQGNENNPNTWKRDGEMAGTSGQAKRLEAIRISLYGEMAEHYDIYYRVHAQSFGWLSWAKNGEASGTAGLAKRLEGIQIVLVPKGSAAPGNLCDGITATVRAAYIKR